MSVGVPDCGVLVATGVFDIQQMRPEGGKLGGYPSRHMPSDPLQPHGPQVLSQRGAGVIVVPGGGVLVAVEPGGTVAVEPGGNVAVDPGGAVAVARGV